MEFIKNNFKYLFIFLISFFILNLLLVNFNGDIIWNYGISHAIKIGEIPYLDFNFICTPLYNFLMSGFLFIKDDIVVFVIEQSLLITFLFYFIFKLHGQKGWLLLVMLSFPIFYQLNATYNFMCFLLIVILFNLEKNKSNDYLIGFVLGLLILSKHTIGIPIFLMNCLYLRDFKRILKRASTCFISCFIFLLYLVFTGSLYSFLDLCFFGLFDFKNSNGSRLLILKIISIIIFTFSIFMMFKDKKNYKWYYLIGGFFFAYPLFDIYHVGLYLSLFTLCILDYYKGAKLIKYFSLFFFSVILIFNFCIFEKNIKHLTFLEREHFSYFIIDKNHKKYVEEKLDKYSKYQNAYMLDECSMIYDILSNKKINYFDLLNKGNFGYNGTKKLISRIKNMHDVYFFIDKEKYMSKYTYSGSQTDNKAIIYAINNSKCVDSVHNFNIYYKE